MFNFLDVVFGDGTAAKIFGEKVNLKTAVDAYLEAVNGVNALDKKLAEYFRSKYPQDGNRQQRRHKSRNGKYSSEKR